MFDFIFQQSSPIRLGLRFVRCPAGHRPWTSVVLIVYQRYHNRHWLRDKAVCWWLCLLSRNQRYRGHCETSGGYRSSWLLGKEMGHEIPTSQMQYHADYKETDKKINASYNLEGTVLDNVENIKYLGITITNDLKWNTHVSNICTKANRTLGFLRRNLSACPQDVKESAYKGLVRPVLEYGSSVWDPSSILLQEELQKVQKRAARFVAGNYIYETRSMTGILEQLKWESLKKRRRDRRIIMLYKGLKGAASIPTSDLVPQLGMSEITILWHFKPPLLILTFTSAASIPRLLEIGIHL